MNESISPYSSLIRFARLCLPLWGYVKHIVGYSRYMPGFLLTHRLYASRDNQGGFKPTPAIDDYNRLVTHLGVPDPGHRMELFTIRADEIAAEEIWRKAQLFRHQEVILLNSGGAFGSAKHWPAESFATLARDLAERRGAGVLVLCGPAECEAARQIVAQANHPNVHSLVDAPVSLGLTKACVRRADLLITTDSGPRHFAAAFGKPVITLFGPTHIEWTETYYPGAIHLQKKVPCGPCQLRTCPLDHRCMKELHPAEVFASANNLLHSFPPKREVQHSA